MCINVIHYYLILTFYRRLQLRLHKDPHTRKMEKKKNLLKFQQKDQPQQILPPFPQCLIPVVHPIHAHSAGNPGLHVLNPLQKMNRSWLRLYPDFRLSSIK